MGSFEYASPECYCTVDDRTLLHLQIIIIDKLRRGEHFAFRCDEPGAPGGSTTFWMAPHIPVRFVYTDPVCPAISREWLNDLARAALTVDGVHLVAEPEVAASEDRELVGSGALH